MKKIYFIIAVLFLANFSFSQESRSKKKLEERIVFELVKKGVNMSNVAVDLPQSRSISADMAAWDLEFTFNAPAASNAGIETDGTNFYTVVWNGPNFTRYDMDGSNPVSFTVPGVANIRDMAYDGTYFYGSDNSMNLYVMDLANENLVNTIPVTCTGVSSIRHISYDPNLDGGNGGFWIGSLSDLGAISMTGTELIPSTVNLQKCMGSAYDNFTDPENPCLWLFSQPTGTESILYQFDINTYAMTGVIHDCSDLEGYQIDAPAGGACTYQSGGKFLLAVSIQQTPNLVAVYELAYTALSSAASAVENLVVNAGDNGALTYSIGWTNPTLDVVGDALTEITGILVYVDDVLVDGLTVDMTVGNTNELTDLTVSGPGNHTFKVVCVNAAGDGIPNSVTEWIGYLPPSNLAIANIEDVTANLSWDQEGTPDSWDIEVLSTGTIATGIPTFTGVTENPFQLTSLTAFTTYDVYMRAVYGTEKSLWTEVLTFTTIACPSEGQCNYEFVVEESATDHWNGAAISVVQNGVEIAQVKNVLELSETYNVAICDSALVELIWISGLFDFEASFVITDPFGHEMINVSDASTLTGNEVFYTFTASCTPPSCPEPTNLTSSGETLTSVVLEWVENGSATSWNVEYGITGFEQGTGNLVVADENPLLLSGLEEGVSYDFYVQADCGADSSYWSIVSTFATECTIINTFPWFDSFEEGIACYTVSGINTHQTWGIGNFTCDTLTGSKCATIEYDPSLANQDEYLISPTFDLSASSGTPQITFNWMMSYGYGVYPDDNYDMYLLATVDGGVNWDTLWTEGTDVFESFSWYEETVSLADYQTSSGFQFAFRYVGSNGAGGFFDDVTIDFGTNVNTISKNEISIYPNPTEGMVKIRNAKNAEITVYNMIGKLVYSDNSKQDVATLNLSNLEKGNYIIKVVSDNEVYTSKVVVLK